MDISGGSRSGPSRSVAIEKQQESVKVAAKPSAALQAEAAKVHADAVRIVEDALRTPEDLRKLPGLVAEYTQRRDTAAKQLSEATLSTVSNSRRALESLARSQGVLQTTRQCFVDIDSLCTECQGLVDQQDKIAMLSTVHNNLSSTQADARAIKNLPDDAAFARELLQKPSRFLEAYEAVVRLEVAAASVKNAMNKNITTSMLSTDSSLQLYFDAVKNISNAFEQRLKSYFYDIPAVGHNKPAILVQAAQVLEIQTILENQVRSAHSNSVHGSVDRKLKDTCWAAMEEGIIARFEPVLAKCNVVYSSVPKEVLDEANAPVDAGQSIKKPKLRRQESHLGKLAMDDDEDEGDDEKGRAARAALERAVAEILEGADNLAGELTVIYDFADCCFPARYGLFRRAFDVYHLRFAWMLDILGASSPGLANRELLSITEWVTGYQKTMAEMLDDQDAVEFPHKATAELPDGTKPQARGLDIIGLHYIQRMKSTVTAWYTNIIQADFHLGAKIDDQGKWWTPGVVDFFRVLYDQVDMVEKVTQGDMLLDTAQAALDIMQSYQKAMKEPLQQCKDMELAAAMVNNLVICHNKAMDFGERIDSVVIESLKGCLDVDQQCTGFLECAKLAMERLVVALLADECFEPLYDALYRAEDWYTGNTMLVLLATIKDYLSNPEDGLKPRMDGSFFKRTAEAVLHSLVEDCTTRMCKRLPMPITQAHVEACQTDINNVRATFRAYIKESKIDDKMEILNNLVTMLSADPEGFMLAYSAVAQGTHDLAKLEQFAPSWVERVLDRRPDFNKRSRSELLAQCRELHSKRYKAVQAAAVDKFPAAMGKAAAGANHVPTSSWFGGGI